jgi:hypothetical protein
MTGRQVGPCISSVWDLRSPSQPVEDGLIIEDMTFPGPFVEIFFFILPGAALLYGKDMAPGHEAEKMERILESLVEGPYKGATNHSFLLGGMSSFGASDQGGSISLADDRVTIDWPDASDPEHNAYVDKFLKAACANL